MINIEIKLLVEGEQKYLALGELESNSLDGNMAHWGYDAADKGSEFERLMHYCKGTPQTQHQALVKLAEKFYPDKEYDIQINIKNKKE
jgi:hypothetical protein